MRGAKVLLVGEQLDPMREGRDLGIAQPALYPSFASKNALVDSIVEWRLEVNQSRFPDAASQARQGLSLRQGLVDDLERVHANFSDPDNVAVHSLVFSELAHHSKVAAKLSRSP
jgi:AcrR family transcriptional regulator